MYLMSLFLSNTTQTKQFPKMQVTINMEFAIVMATWGGSDILKDIQVVFM